VLVQVLEKIGVLLLLMSRGMQTYTLSHDFELFFFFFGLMKIGVLLLLM